MYGYHCFGTQTIAATADTTLTVERTSGRVYITEFITSFEGTIADNQYLVTAQRTTVDGTGTSFTPIEDDTDGPAAQATCLVDHSGEPTYTSNQEVFQMYQNMRATYRWQGGEAQIVIPDTSAAGIGWFTLHSASTDTHHMAVRFKE